MIQPRLLFDLQPQPSAYPDVLGDLLKFASDSLRDGTWKRHVDAALETKVAGESVNKDLLLYSGISSVLPTKLHVLTQGTSQFGKSYLERKVGEMLFRDRFEDVSSLSAKAIYFEVREKKNPKLYADKIAFVDELADAPEVVQMFIKAATSQGVEHLKLKSVDDMKYLESFDRRTPGLLVVDVRLSRGQGQSALEPILLHLDRRIG